MAWAGTKTDTHTTQACAKTPSFIIASDKHLEKMSCKQKCNIVKKIMIDLVTS